MTSDSSPDELRGLALSIHRLFAEEPDRPAPGEMEQTPDDGGDDVAWVAESGVRLPGDTSAPDPLLVAVRRYVQSDEAERGSAQEGLEGAAADARSRRAGAALADAAEALVHFSAKEPGALETAREMVTPGVATILVGRVSEAAHDEDRRAELVRLLPPLGEEMALAVLEALKEEALDADADRTTRRALLSIVSAIADQGSDILSRMASDPDWRLVRNAIHLIGERGEADAVARLKGTLEHDDPRVRREALMALSKLGGEEVGVLAKVRLEDPDPSVRGQAARTVGVLNVELALRPLLSMLEHETDQGVILEVIRSVGLLGDPSAVPHLEKRAVSSLFSRTPQEVRVAAYRALGAIGSPHAMQLVESAAEDKDAEVRHTAQAILTARDE